MTREATVRRETKETKIEVVLRLEGGGRVDVATGIGMLNHMIEQLGRHGGFDLKVHAEGDLHVDAHHTVEDIGLALGKALNEALGDRAGIARMADRTVPLDEALVHAAARPERPPLHRDRAALQRRHGGELPTPLVPHFFESFAQEGRFALHLRQLAGENDHHIMESAFKATARALRDAVVVIDAGGACRVRRGRCRPRRAARAGGPAIGDAEFFFFGSRAAGEDRREEIFFRRPDARGTTTRNFFSSTRSDARRDRSRLAGSCTHMQEYGPIGRRRSPISYPRYASLVSRDTVVRDERGRADGRPGGRPARRTDGPRRLRRRGARSDSPRPLRGASGGPGLARICTHLQENGPIVKFRSPGRGPPDEMSSPV